MSPTGRSLEYLRRLGYVTAVVESWVPRVNVRRDLWGFGDLLAVHPRDGLFLIVQATTAAHIAHRLTKAKGKPELAAWLKAGGLFHVHGWERRGDRWTVRVVAVRRDDLADVILLCPRSRRRRRGEGQAELFAG